MTVRQRALQREGKCVNCAKRVLKVGVLKDVEECRLVCACTKVKRYEMIVKCCRKIALRGRMP